MDMAAEIENVKRRMYAGECDLRDVGLLLTGRWDQDFPAALLNAAISHTLRTDITVRSQTESEQNGG